MSVFETFRVTLPMSDRLDASGSVLATVWLIAVAPVVSWNTISGVAKPAPKAVMLTVSPPFVITERDAVGAVKSTNSPSVESMRVRPPPASVIAIVSAPPVKVKLRLTALMLSMIGSRPV